MSQNTNEAVSIQKLRITDLDKVLGGTATDYGSPGPKNVQNNSYSGSFKPTTTAQPWTPQTGNHGRHRY